MMTKATKEAKAAERAEDIANLRRLVPTGTTVYALERYTGAGRFLRFYAFPQGQAVCLSGILGRLSGRRMRDGEVYFAGGGYSAVHEGVEELSRAAHGTSHHFRAERLS
jgi:hypothetical protein